MKKLLIIMTLFMSSFFLFCNKEVEAAVYNFTYDVDLSIFNEEFFNNRKQLLNFLESDTSNSDYYIISYESGNIVYYVLPLGCDTSKVISRANSYAISIIYQDYLGIYNISSNIVSGGTSQLYNHMHLNNFIIDSNVPFNFDNFNVGTTVTFNFNEYSYSFVVEAGLKLPTLYDLYLDYNKEQPNPHQEEIDKVTNFYSMVIEKIGYLAEQIVNNYILLFIIGIFILIFIFLLIFMRFIC